MTSHGGLASRLASTSQDTGRRLSTDRRPHWLAGVDWVLLAAVAALCVAGAVSVYAATRNGLVAQHRNPMAYLQRDLLNDAVGLLIAVPVALLPARLLRSYVPAFYAAVLLLLVVVLGRVSELMR